MSFLCDQSKDFLARRRFVDSRVMAGSRSSNLDYGGTPAMNISRSGACLAAGKLGRHRSSRYL
jgi:hypothetical protein